jgi:hypothetical protein
MSLDYARFLRHELMALPHVCATPPAQPAPPGPGMPLRCPCERARARILSLLVEAHRQGRTREEVFDEQLRQYRLWSRHVLKSPPESGDTFELEDFQLFYVLGMSLGNLDNPTPALKHYLFFRLRHRLGLRDEVNAYLWGGPAGPSVPQSLHRILASHMRFKRLRNRHGQNLYTKEDYFHYEDLDDLFRTEAIVAELCDLSLAEEARELADLAAATHHASEKLARTVERTKRYVPLTELFALRWRGNEPTPFQKTYRDRCGGFLNYKGWFSVLSNFLLVALAPYAFGLFLIVVLYLASHPFATDHPLRTQLIVVAAVGLGFSILFPLFAWGLRIWNRTGRPPPVRLDAGVVAPRNLGWRYRCGLYGFLGLVWGIKLTYSYFVLSWVAEPIRQLSPGHVVWLRAGHSSPLLAYLGLALLVLPYLLFFVLDLFTVAYSLEAVVSFFVGRARGLGHLTRWRRLPTGCNWLALGRCVAEEFRRIQKDIAVPPERAREPRSVLREFRDRFLPPDLALSPAEQRVAWARTWNFFMQTLYEEHKLTAAEYHRLTYGLDEDASPGASFLSACFTRQPDVSVPPFNREARQRVQFFLESLYMTMPAAPAWDRILSLSTLTPIYEEEILFSLQDLTVRENTGYSILGRLLVKFPDEWWNFVRSLERDALVTPAEAEDLSRAVTAERVLAALGLDRPGPARPEVVERLRFWAGLRGQEVARSVRGLVNRWRAWELLARIHFPSATALEDSLGLDTGTLARYVAQTLPGVDGPLTRERVYDLAIQMKVQEKLQIIVSHQPYATRAFAPGGKQHHKRAELERLLRRFPFLQLAHLDQDPATGRWSSVLRQWDGRELAVLERVELPSEPTQPVILGEGKPENQNHALKFVRGQIINVRDCNDDMRGEDALKEPNAFQEFAHDPDLQILGFPEVIQTAPLTWVGRVFALADRSFAMLGTRFLALLQVRMHYGRDYMRMAGVRQLGGVSHPAYINEDVFAGLLATIQGRKVKQIEFLQSLKGREVHFVTASGLLSKFGAGAGQQAVGRVFQAFNTSPVVGLWRAHLYFLACIGFYLRKRLVVVTGLVVVFCVVFLGLSGYISYPDEVLFGYLGVLASQSTSFLAYFQLLFDVPLLAALAQYAVLLPLLQVVFFPMVYVSADSFSRGIRGRAAYVQTGRGYVLQHFPPYLPHGSRVRRLRGGRAPLEIDAVCRQYPSVRWWADLTLVIGLLGVFLWQSLALLWSVLFLLMPLLAFLTPYFLANHGATPLGVGGRRWFALLREDVFWWRQRLRWSFYSHLGWRWRVWCHRLRRVRFGRASAAGRFRQRAGLVGHLVLTAGMVVVYHAPAAFVEIAYTFTKGGFLFLLILLTGVALIPVSWAASIVHRVGRYLLRRAHDRACERTPHPRQAMGQPTDYQAYPYTRFPAIAGLR